MDHLRLGDSGLQVSRIILGCMSYGDASRGGHAWTLGLDESRAFYRQAWEAGITTFDTANVYSLGSSEEFLRILMGEIAKRDEYVIATKVHGRMFDGPKGGGLSRAAILTAIDDSLRRLGTDYVDLYQIHRWDPQVPIEETMETLNDIVRAGKARYIGASSMWAWQFAQAQHVADLNGWTRFVSMQDQYSLLYREEEREMHPYCRDQGVGVIPWSPIARGRLARPWGEETERARTDQVIANNYKQQVDSDRRVVEAVAQIAGERGVPMARIAYAWVLHQSVVTAPIVGATKPGQLDDAIAAVDLELSEDELRRLEEHYAPRLAEGF
jgi:aryl-alcohol dehydrogenase-like predicted oxidoreductase